MTTNRRKCDNWLVEIWLTTGFLAVFLSAAAVVFEMGPQGRVRQVKSSRGLSASAPAFLEETSAPETSADTQTVAMETEPPTVDTSKNVEEPGKEKQTRRHGDMQLYTYFLRSTSAWLFVLYFIVDAVAATMERMPRKFPIPVFAPQTDMCRNLYENLVEHASR